MYSVATYRLSTGNKAEELSSKAFFLDNNEKVLFELRHAIQRNEKQFYCGYCGKELKICGGGEGINKDCISATNTKISMIIVYIQMKIV
jgi:hypothetical protein